MKEYLSLRAVHQRYKTKTSFVTFSRQAQKYVKDKELGIVTINSGTTKRYAVPVESVDALLQKINIK